VSADASSEDVAPPALLERARAAMMEARSDAPELAAAAAEAYARASDDTGTAQALRVRGQALRVQGRHEEALGSFAAAADCARRCGDPLVAARVRIGSIDSLGMLGRVDEAISVATGLEREFRALGAEDDAARVLVNVGNLRFRQDDYHAALDCYERARAVFARHGDPLALARVDASRGNILTQLLRVEEAIALYRSANDAFAGHGMAMEAAMGEGNVGWLEYVSGRLSDALACFHRARQAFEARGQVIETAKADLDLGDIYRNLNLLPEALERYDQALAVFHARGLPYENARATMGRAAVLAAQGQTDEALEGLRGADAHFAAQGNRPQRAYAGLLRASILASTDQAEAAREEAGPAAAVFSRAGLHGWAAEARFIPAELDLRLGKDGADRMRRIAAVARRTLRGWLECRAEAALGRYHRDFKGPHRGAALRHFRRAVAALEAARTAVVPEEMHVAFLRDKIGVYEELIALLLERRGRKDVEEALAHLERSRSRLLLDRVRSAVPTAAEETDTGRRVAALRAELNRVYHQLHDFDSDSPRRLAGSPHSPEAAARAAELEQAYRGALRDAEIEALAHGTGEIRDRLTSQPLPSLEALREAAGTEETLVELIVAGGSVSAVVIDSGGHRLLRGIARTEDVQQAARRLRYHIQRAGMSGDYLLRHARHLAAGMDEVLNCLYQHLWKPLEAHVRTERVTVIPHGMLHGLPFHAFCDSGTALLDRHEFAYSPSAALWNAGRRSEAAARRERKPGCPLLVMGVPVAGIEEVVEEVEDIASVEPDARVFCGAEATLERFAAHAGECRAVHLATHALFRADNPLFSGLRFHDGWLLARDLYSLRLDCDLATLSACHTGVTQVAPGDELFGLVRGFLVAGARSIAASLWAADDKATSALMRRFYRHLAAGESRAASLRHAQKDVRETHPHAYHWAAFALIGER
jgi:CHAT domain-containing protein